MKNPDDSSSRVHVPALLIALLAIVGGIGVVGGGTGIVLGPVTSADAQVIAPSTSSEYRFLSAVWFSLGALMWWSLRRPIERATVTKVILISAIMGGIGRLVSLLLDGWPGPFALALIVELVILPLLLRWQIVSIRSTTT